MQDLSHEANGVSADSHDKSGRSAPNITKHMHPGKGVTITGIDKALHNVKDGSKWVANKPLIQSQGMSRTEISKENDHYLAEIKSLKAIVNNLKSDLDKSESLRGELAKKLNILKEISIKDSPLGEVIKHETNCWIGDKDDNRMGLLWNLINTNDCLKTLNGELMKLNHASRVEGEHPFVVVSKRHLEIASFPVQENHVSSWNALNKAFSAQTNMCGHIFVPETEVEVTAGFAGAKGNLIWFNSGESDVLLKLKTGKMTKSIVLESGFGFCLGRRKRFTRVFISSFERAKDRFEDMDPNVKPAHALFF